MSTSQAEGTAAGQRRRWPGRRVAAIVAAVVVVVAGGTYLGVRLGSGSGLPTSGLATMWARQSQVGDDSGCLPGGRPWIADGLAVTCAGNGALAAYRFGTGRVAWTWHVPSAPRSLPGQAYPSVGPMSVSTDDGIGVFEYTYGQGIAGIVGLDIATGRQLWQMTPRGAAAAASDLNIWEGDGRFDLLPDSGGVLQVYDLATGAPEWSSASSNIAPAGCDVQDTTITGPWIYAVTYCSDRADQLYQMSLPTGSVIAKAPLQDAPCKAQSDSYPTLWAIGGYVLSGCTSVPDSRPDVVIIPAGGVQQRALPWTWIGNKGYASNNDFLNDLSDEVSDAQSAPDIAIGGGTLYVGQSLLLSNNQDLYQVAAIDLATARLRWYKTISIPGEAPNSVTYPVNVIGAGSSGVLDVIENVSSNSQFDTGTTGMTLALLSATDGNITYGPGTSYQAGLSNQPSFTLAGGVLLSFPACPLANGCSGARATGTVTAYGIGSWPG